MVEKIVKIMRPSVKGKKYTALVRDTETKKERKVSFGSKSYSQFRDSTPLKLYSANNHLDKERRRNYFMRHSGVPTKREALAKERGNRITPKYLSHFYLWIVALIVLSLNDIASSMV